MSALSAIGQIVNVADNVRSMPDPKSVVLSNCVRLVRIIAAKCPIARQECDEIMLDLDYLERRQHLKDEPTRLPQDFARFRKWNDAAVEYLKSNELTEARGNEIFEALVAGNMPRTKEAGAIENFWRALNSKNRTDTETIKVDPKDRETWIIRLRPEAAKKPPSSTEV